MEASWARSEAGTGSRIRWQYPALHQPGHQLQCRASWRFRKRDAQLAGQNRHGYRRARAMRAQLLVLNRNLGDPDPAIRDAYPAAERTGDRLALGLTLSAEALLYVQKNLDKSASLGQRALDVLEGERGPAGQASVIRREPA